MKRPNATTIPVVEADTDLFVLDLTVILASCSSVCLIPGQVLFHRPSERHREMRAMRRGASARDLGATPSDRIFRGLLRSGALERDDLQLAQASTVANDVDQSDLVPGEGEDQHPQQPAERRDNHSD